jgi:hypothetical protein
MDGMKCRPKARSAAVRSRRHNPQLLDHDHRPRLPRSASALRNPGRHRSGPLPRDTRRSARHRPMTRLRRRPVHRPKPQPPFRQCPSVRAVPRPNAPERGRWGTPGPRLRPTTPLPVRVQRPSGSARWWPTDAVHSRPSRDAARRRWATRQACGWCPRPAFLGHPSPRSSGQRCPLADPPGTHERSSSRDRAFDASQRCSASGTGSGQRAHGVR